MLPKVLTTVVPRAYGNLRLLVACLITTNHSSATNNPLLLPPPPSPLLWLALFQVNEEHEYASRGRLGFSREKARRKKKASFLRVSRFPSISPDNSLQTDCVFCA